MLQVMFVGFAVATWMTIINERIYERHPTGDSFKINWVRYFAVLAGGAAGAVAGNYLFTSSAIGSDPMPSLLAFSSVAAGVVSLTYR